METEQQLLHAIQHGDRTALRRLYDRYSGYAMATALRYIPQRDMAADAVQDAFVKILTAIGTFSYRGEGSLRAWVTRIAANQAVDLMKQQSRFRFVSLEADLGNDRLALADTEPDVGRMAPDVLQKLITQLPDGYRAVLNLYVFEGRSHKEIAQLLGIKPDTSASQYSRAKRMLARMINETLPKE